ncbi:retrovirus-related pol polyprotein from transposon TNT 1-94 [Tanacetum coccineum]
MAARDSDDTLGCCVENTVEDRIMDSDASFHATYCKEELERFKLLSGKVRLADDKTLDIASIGDVVLKTYFSTSWTLRMLGTNMESMYMVEVHPKRIGAIINGSGSATVWFGEAEESFLYNVSEDKETTETVMLKIVPETPLQFGVAERLSRTFRAESTGLCAEASKMLWADSVSTTYLIYRIPYVLTGLRIPKEEWRGKDTSLAHLKAAAQMKCDTAFGIRRVTRLSEVEILHLWTRFLEPGGSKNSGSFEDSGRSDEEYSEDGASSKEGGSETPQSYSEALSSKESVQWKKAIIEEMVSLEKNQTCSLEPSYVGALNDTSTQHKSEGFQLAGQEENLECKLKKSLYELKQAPRQWYLKFDSFMQRAWYKRCAMDHLFEMKDRCSEKQVLGYVLTVGVTTVEWESRLQKSITMVLILVEDSWNEEPCRDVHQVGDEREVEVLRIFKWPPSELMTEDGVLPERVYSQFNDVSSGYLVSKVS